MVCTSTQARATPSSSLQSEALICGILFVHPLTP